MSPAAPRLRPPRRAWISQGRRAAESHTRDDLMADIQTSLSSRAAGELFLGIAMSGVTSDLAQAGGIDGQPAPVVEGAPQPNVQGAG